MSINVAADTHIIGSGAGSMWVDFEYGRPGVYTNYFEEFHTYVAGDWTVTETDASATEALSTTGPGLLITNANADNNLVSMQKLGHAFVPTANKNIFFEITMQLSEATQIDWFAGLVATDTDPVTSIANGIMFKKDDGDTNIDVQQTVSSVSSTENAIGTFAADTDIKLGFKVVGVTRVEYWINDVLITRLVGSIPSGVPLRVTFGHQDGDTGGALGALTQTVKRIYVAQQI